ncbi:hypothetical protein QKW35_17030 [Pontibacterium granulatum]|uniref:hypothetical protein n=1 Tax=Pontibacterium granulatum TaxID=2036029 RepID=UPI00249AA505|nr:hypothetical protein [Pontibacterium granulatum]MDI3326085.1 hypothetical protein [Pontibacterium granulatum]
MLTWLYTARALGVLDWGVSLVPEEHAGAGVMLAIMISMAPALFLWKLWTRWVERKLDIKGKYYEDDFYKEDLKNNKK